MGFTVTIGLIPIILLFKKQQDFTIQALEEHEGKNELQKCFTQ
jgi:hypothetical protein